MILKLKYASSMLSPVYIDQIADAAPEPGCYYMHPGKQRKWEVHTRVHGKDDGHPVGLLLDEDCTLLTGNLEPENIETDEEEIRVPLRVLRLTLRDGTKRSIYYATEFFDVFLMSDEGKTIDRLPR